MASDATAWLAEIFDELSSVGQISIRVDVDFAIQRRGADIEPCAAYNAYTKQFVTVL